MHSGARAPSNRGDQVVPVDGVPARPPTRGRVSVSAWASPARQRRRRDPGTTSFWRDSASMPEGAFAIAPTDDALYLARRKRHLPDACS
ncbi:MAG: hypothetical protein QOI95_3074 [Acidimicrobiaceae bacterium]|jgi:hypothetical protein